jgi:hypothetical protein
VLRRADPLVGAVGEDLALPYRQPRLDRVDQFRTGGECRLPMVGGDGDHQRRFADLQDTDPVAGRNGPRA